MYPCCFDCAVAVDHSMEEAIILNYLGLRDSQKDYWLSDPEPQELFRAEGDLFWINFSIGDDFIYWTQQQFERYLKRLIKKKLLIKTKFNNQFWVRFPMTKEGEEND